MALAEKRLLQDVTAKMQQAQQDERAAANTARDRADAAQLELLARLEVAESAARTASDRLSALESDHRVLGEKYAAAVGQVRTMQGEHRQMEATLRDLRHQHQALCVSTGTVPGGHGRYAMIEPSPVSPGAPSPPLDVAHTPEAVSMRFPGVLVPGGR